MKNRSIAILSLTLLTIASSMGQPSNPDITAADLQYHVRYLASDALEGRGSGSPGNRKAAEYIASELRRYGVAPAGVDGNYFQPFSFVAAVKLGPENAMRLEEEGGTRRVLALDTDFRPLGFSASGNVEGAIVFAGYGISAPDQNYDDYAGLDVSGKIVVVLRWAPDGDSPRSEFARHTSLREKARVARDKGALAVVLINGPADESEDALLKFTFDQVAGTSGIPIISAKREIFAPALRRLGKDLKTIQDSIRTRKKAESFPLQGVRASLRTDVVSLKAQTANVLGILKGSDESQASDYLVLGAHFDHLGWGGQGSGSTRPDTIAIHNGADDNASGTAGLLEIAQKFASEKGKLKRSILFTFFSGEELGTLGSIHFVSNPTIPLSQVVSMINMDMIGRLDKRSLTIGGTGTSPVWKGLLAKYNRDSAFAITEEPEGFGPSDHSSFYGKNIPVLFFFTGTHSDYHKPSDDWNLINYPGEEKVVLYVYRLAQDVVSMAERPTYARVESRGSRSGQGDTRSFSVTLGVVPDFGQSEGMKISAVQPGRPAEKAGLLAGDVITKLAGKPILNIYDYMGVLGELKPGDVVEIEIKRNGNPLSVTATMEKRK